MDHFVNAHTYKDSAGDHSRRNFLLASAAIAGAAALTASAQDAPPAQPAGDKDAYALAQRFAKFLRVTDVTDGLDALGRADKCLPDPAIRPLWMGCRLCGLALTMRVFASHWLVPVLTRTDSLRQHGLRSESGGFHVLLCQH